MLLINVGMVLLRVGVLRAVARDGADGAVQLFLPQGVERGRALRTPRQRRPVHPHLPRLQVSKPHEL